MWTELKSGNKNALEQIYREHAEVMLRYGIKICGDSTIVEDCIQNLFITIWERRESLGDTDSIRNYLLASLRRAIYKYGDKKSIAVDPVELRKEDGEKEATFEDLMIKKEMDAEQKEKFKVALAEISARQREVIYLRYYQDKDYDEICEIMGITYQGARNMLFKALKSLKKHLMIWIILYMQWVTKLIDWDY